MKFESATIKDYKRFTDLTVKGIPDTSRLIMLSGPNGSGKSSFFDALSSWHKMYVHGNTWDDDYHMKIYAREAREWNKGKISITFHQPLPNDVQGKRN